MRLNELRELFKCRDDVYAECWYNKQAKRWSYKSIKKKLTKDLFRRHITDPKFSGIGVYPLLEGNMTKWISADFDFHSEGERKEMEEALIRMEEVADDLRLKYYVEMSKSGNGVHIWVFFSEEIESWKARRFMGGFLMASGANDLSSMDRFFPSQDRLFQTGKGFGNLIHLPFSASHIDRGTFFNVNGSKLKNTEDDIDIFLDEVELHNLEYVETVLKKWDLLDKVDSSVEYEEDKIEYEYSEDGLQQVLQDPFIQWCMKFPDKVDYYAWIAMITNLAPYGDEGREAIHMISRLSPDRYNKKQTDMKIILCEGIKPITYNWIAKNTNFNEKVIVTYKSPAVAGIKTSHMVSPVFENSGCYFFKQKRDVKKLSNFVIEPVKIVKVDDTITRVWNIIAEDCVLKDIDFTADELSGSQAFRKKLMSLYHKVLWYGADLDLIHTLDYLNQHYPKLPLVKGRSSVGMFRDEISSEWCVLTQIHCWDRNSEKDDYIYFNSASKKEILFKPTETMTKNEMDMVKKNLFMFNGLDVCANILGWCFSLFVKQRLYDNHSVRFPVIMIHGQAGSGKSETGRHIVQPLFGDIASMMRVDDITGFAFTMQGSSTNMFPLIYDEYKPALFDNSKLKLVSRMIRGLYDNETSLRGTKDLSVKEFKIFSPAVIIGEQGFEEPALKERSIDVFFSKDVSTEYINNFVELSKSPLTKFGNMFLNWTLRLDDEFIFKKFTSNIKKNGRVYHNIAMLQCGIDLLALFFKENNINIKAEPLKKAIYDSQIKSQTVSGHTRSVVDNIVEALMIMRESGVINGGTIDIGDEEIKVHTPTVYPYFKKWAKDYSFEGEVISHGEFVKQLKHMNYYDGYRSVRMGASEDVKKCRILNINKLKEMEIIE